MQPVEVALRGTWNTVSTLSVSHDITDVVPYSEPTMHAEANETFIVCVLAIALAEGNDLSDD